MAKENAPLQSMTGFARVEGQLDKAAAGYRWTWEARSLNSRGLDLKCRLPAWLENLESEVRTRLGKKVSRGSATINLQLRSDLGEGRLTLNNAALAQVISALEKIKLQTECALPTADGILGIKGVLNLEENQDTPELRKDLTNALLESFDSLIELLMKSRQEEGAKLAVLVSDQINQIETLTGHARDTAEMVPAAIKDRLETQLANLLGENMDPERLAQEAALLAVKADVREELDRLDAHVTAARKLMGDGAVIGRKFDFLVQEFNREANTLCSKAQTIELKQIGLDLKTIIDQMREQIQNIE